MSLRKITSLTLGFSFLILALTGIILYFVPQGRIAYWADWRLWNLSKTQWTNIHINLALLSVVAGILHTYYNWRSIMLYLKNKAKQLKVFTLNFNIALLISIFLIQLVLLDQPIPVRHIA